jgi:CheY-like chemotaxis protein
MHKARGLITVVMAEDDPDDRLLVSEAFKDAKIPAQVEFVPDGEALLMLLRGEGPYGGDHPPPGLLLLDLNMPRMGGLETLIEIRAQESLRHLPVIVLTTSTSREDILAAYRAGCNAYLCKPSTFAGLVETVQLTLHYWLNIVEIPAPR